MEKKVCYYPECFVCCDFVKKGLVLHYTNDFYDQFYFCSIECLLKSNRWHLEHPPDGKIHNRDKGTKDQSTQTEGIYHPCKTDQTLICQLWNKKR